MSLSDQPNVQSESLLGYEVGSQASSEDCVVAPVMLQDASLILEQRTTDMLSPSPSVIPQQQQRVAEIILATVHSAEEESSMSDSLREESKTVPDMRLGVMSPMEVNPGEDYVTPGDEYVTPGDEYVTPGDENVTRGNQEVEMVDITPGGVDRSSIDNSSILPDSLSVDWLQMEGGGVQKKEGDCDRIYPYRICLSLCTTSLMALFIVCFIFYPKPVELCLKLSLDDEDIMEKVLDDTGNYKLSFTNPNSLDVDIYGLEISAYYEGVTEENRLLNARKMDYHISAHSTLRSNHTYTFTQDCTATVPIATLHGCYTGYRSHITYDMVTSFKACVLSFVCHEGIVSKFRYKSNCPEEEMVCTDLGFFQHDW